MTPEEGIRAHLDLQGGASAGLMLPIHWGTFNLAAHAWSDPAEGTIEAARKAHARIALPHPGEPFEPAAGTVPSAPWWRDVALTPEGGWPSAGADVAADTSRTADVTRTADVDDARTDTAGDIQGGAADGSGQPRVVPAG
ncbi:hypothetical protein [Streptomyces sp. ADMS]|uniref:hypothetical protein n=1 Tax=Streptomyces sp. ADMS TaxID=3071415 RepID=UPI0039954612